MYFFLIVTDYLSKGDVQVGKVDVQADVPIIKNQTFTFFYTNFDHAYVGSFFECLNAQNHSYFLKSYKIKKKLKSSLTLCKNLLTG